MHVLCEHGPMGQTTLRNKRIELITFVLSGKTLYLHNLASKLADERLELRNSKNYTVTLKTPKHAKYKPETSA